MIGAEPGEDEISGAGMNGAETGEAEQGQQDPGEAEINGDVISGTEKVQSE